MIRQNTKRILLISAAIIFMGMIAFNFSTVWQYVCGIVVVLQPVIIGFCLAFILNLVMTFFENTVFKKLSTEKKPRRMLVRILSIVCTIIVVITVIALILLVIIPQVVQTVNSIIASVPGFATRSIEFVRELLERMDVKPSRISELLLGGEQFFDKLTTFAQTHLNSVVKSLVSIGSEVVGGVTDVFFGIFIAVYFLADKERVIRQCSRLARAAFKSELYEKLAHVSVVSAKTFSSFITGQLMEAVILGILCFIGMLIFGFPYAPVIAVLIGVTALVPIVGPWIGGIISAVLILTKSPVQALWFLVFLVVLQQIEGNFIYPKVVGKQVGLPGVWVLLAVIVGSGLFGAGGAFVSVPVAAIAYVLITEFVVKHEKQHLEEVPDDRPVE